MAIIEMINPLLTLDTLISIVFMSLIVRVSSFYVTPIKARHYMLDVCPIHAGRLSLRYL